MVGVHLLYYKLANLGVETWLCHVSTPKFPSFYNRLPLPPHSTPTQGNSIQNLILPFRSRRRRKLVLTTKFASSLYNIRSSHQTYFFRTFSNRFKNCFGNYVTTKTLYYWAKNTWIIRNCYFSSDVLYRLMMILIKLDLVLYPYSTYTYLCRDILSWSRGSP